MTTMLATNIHGQTICRECRMPLKSYEDWSRHQSNHTLEYWAKWYGQPWETWNDVLQSLPSYTKERT